MIKILMTSLFLSVCLFPGKVFADSGNQYYAEIMLGLSLPPAAEVATGQGTINLESDAGSQFGAAFGLILPAGGLFGDGRVGIEYSYRSNSFSSAEFSNGTFPASGDLAVHSLLLDSFAEFPTQWPVTPYFGVGVGIALSKVSDLQAGGRFLVNDEDLTPAGQAGCGIFLELSQALQIDLGYRFFYTRLEFQTLSGSEVKMDAISHIGMVGISRKF